MKRRYSLSRRMLHTDSGVTPAHGMRIEDLLSDPKHAEAETEINTV
jgi:hypothetical protein